jgi:hypothetical protein
MEWKDLTIKKYQEIFKVYNTEKDTMIKKIRILSILTGKEESFYHDLVFTELSAALGTLKFLDHLPEISKPKKYIKVGTQWFKVNYDLSTFTSSMFIDLTKFAESEATLIKNLPMVMAVVCEPVKWWGGTKKMDFTKKAEILQEAKYVDCNNVAAFFLATLMKLPAAIQRYSTEIVKGETKKILKSLPRHLRNIGAGLPQSTTSPMVTEQSGTII